MAARAGDRAVELRRVAGARDPHVDRATLAVATFASTARADRIGVLAIESPGRAAPVADADAVAAALLARGHRTITSPDASARLSAGDEGAGVDWAAQTIAELATARAALTRLDRSAASNASRRIGQEIARRGGGAEGAEVLVEWALLERSAPQADTLVLAPIGHAC